MAQGPGMAAQITLLVAEYHCPHLSTERSVPTLPGLGAGVPLPLRLRLGQDCRGRCGCQRLRVGPRRSRVAAAADEPLSRLSPPLTSHVRHADDRRLRSWGLRVRVSVSAPGRRRRDSKSVRPETSRLAGARLLPSEVNQQRGRKEAAARQTRRAGVAVGAAGSYLAQDRRAAHSWRVARPVVAFTQMERRPAGSHAPAGPPVRPPGWRSLRATGKAEWRISRAWYFIFSIASGWWMSQGSLLARSCFLTDPFSTFET